jgi:IclR family transcriptional regulator, pca regulon regulatory protein
MKLKVKPSFGRQRLKETNIINSLKRGLDILEAFTPEHPRLRFNEIVEKTKFPKPTVFRFLQSLLSLHYVSFDPLHKCYFLSPKVISLGSTALSSVDLRENALPHLNQLSERTGQNISMGILYGDEVVIIERIEKKQIVKFDFHIHIGSHINAYQTSLGRAILAFLDPELFNPVLMKILQDVNATKYVGRKGKLFLSLLEGVRRKGYATADEELAPGLRAIAAPVFNNQNKVEAAINIPVFSHEITRSQLIKKYVSLLLDTAEKISVSLGSTRKSLSLSV